MIRYKAVRCTDVWRGLGFWFVPWVYFTCGCRTLLLDYSDTTARCKQCDEPYAYADMRPEHYAIGNEPLFVNAKN